MPLTNLATSHKAFIDHIELTIAQTKLCTEEEFLKTDWFSYFAGGCKAKEKRILKYIAEANTLWQENYVFLETAKKPFAQSLGFTACIRKANVAIFANMK